MKNDKYYRAILSTNEALESLYRNNNIDNWVLEDEKEVELYRKYYNNFKLDYEDHDDLKLQTVDELLDNVKIFHKKNQETWLIDKEYINFDIHTWLLNQCKNKEQVHRVLAELVLYEERNLFPVLRVMKYLVDKMREHKIVWGVGRGSSVSSYCLYLIGIHKIDSLKYNLDISEFLK